MENNEAVQREQHKQCSRQEQRDNERVESRGQLVPEQDWNSFIHLLSGISESSKDDTASLTVHGIIRHMLSFTSTPSSMNGMEPLGKLLRIRRQLVFLSPLFSSCQSRRDKLSLYSSRAFQFLP